jgi:predicted nucleic acid-binding Zn ribbon protein
MHAIVSYKNLRLGKWRWNEPKGGLKRPKAAHWQIPAERREGILVGVISILRSGNPTRFAHEGACRHGLRAALCLEGHSWDDADAATSSIISDALHRLGAVRPPWWEGQSEYADTDASKGLCSYSRCGNPIPLDRGVGLRSVKFCSDECGMYAHNERVRRFGNKYTLAEYLAMSAARTQRTIEQHSGDCEVCGRHFVAQIPGRRYCSRRCFFKTKTLHAERSCGIMLSCMRISSDVTEKRNAVDDALLIRMLVRRM